MFVEQTLLVEIWNKYKLGQFLSLKMVFEIDYHSLSKTL